MDPIALHGIPDQLKYIRNLRGEGFWGGALGERFTRLWPTSSTMRAGQEWADSNSGAYDIQKSQDMPIRHWLGLGWRSQLLELPGYFEAFTQGRTFK